MMWGGIEFFVSIEVLLSATVPSSFQSALASSSGSKASRSSSSSSASPARYAGNPCTHRVAFTRERRPTSFFIYPNATLFLQVLRSSGNRVHLITPWSKEDTSAILKACDWVELLTDARRVFRLPRTTDYSFASLGIDPASYVRTVLVVDDAARWNASTALQLVEVRHDRDAVHSMELLYAMSRCVHYAEWLLRYPLSSIASCVAMTNTILFAYCRFFFRGGDVNTELMLLVSFHGGRVVASEAEATHVVVLPPPEPLSSSSSTTSSSEGDTEGSSSSSGEESAVDSSDADSSSDGDDADGRKKGELIGRRGRERPFGGTDRSSTSKAEPNEDPTAPPLAASPSSLSSANATRVLTLPAPVNGSSSPTATAAAAAAAPLPVRAPAAVGSPSALSISSVRTVTPEWVYQCVRALRVVPVDVDDGDDSEGGDVADAASGASHEEQGGRHTQSVEEGRRRAAHQSTLLLCCLLPPPDVGPLLWTTFCSIARQHHYDLRCFADGSTSSSNRRTAGESVAVKNSAKHRSSSPLTFTAMKVLAALTEPSLSDVVEVRLLPSASEAKPTNGAAPTRPRGFAVNSTTLPTLRLSSAAAELSRLALFRVSRRLDKEAVLAHLQLTASQFLVSYEHVLRRRSRLMHVDAGTQTSGPRHASMGVMTEKVDLDDGEKDGASSESAPSVSPRDSGEHTTSPTHPTATAAEDTGAVDAEAWRHHLKNVEGKLLSHHPAVKKDAAARESAAVVSGGGGASSSGTRKEVAAAAGQRVETVPEKADASSGATSPPPPPPQLRTSFTSPPSVSAPTAQAGQRALPIDVEVAPPEAHPGEYTACFIPTVYLSPTQEEDFFEELRSYPIFASPELGNRVVRLPDGVKCVFATHDAAEGFHRIDYIEYLSLRLPIYPFFEDPQPQQAEMNFPLPPSLPTAVSTTTPTAAATTASPQLLWKVCETPSYFPMDAHGPPPPPSSFSPSPPSASSARPPPLSASQRRSDHHNSSGGSRGRDSGPAPPRRPTDAPPPPLASHPPHRRQRDDSPGSPRRSPPRRQRRSDERRSRGSDDARDRRDRVDRYEGRGGSYSSHRRRHDDSVEPPRRGESGSSGFRPHYRSRRDSR